MIIRVQSPEGMHRVNLADSASISDLYQKTSEAAKIDREWSLYKDREKKSIIKKASRASLGLKHGDIVYLVFNSGLNVTEQETKTAPVKATEARKDVREDPVDVVLWTKKWDHGSKKGMNKVDELNPDPWDASYLKEKEIKFLSFHSYMRKITSGIDKGKFVSLEKLKTSRKIEEGENTRALSEMATAITLNRQIYRHVDNVCFQNREVMDRFLERWRSTGHQQAGWLFGKYDVHEDVPFGIKCVVFTIYPIPTTNAKNEISLCDDPNEQQILEIAKRMGLERVGWIVTDLVPDKDGKVKDVRNKDTHYVTAEECIIAGKLQDAHPNPCRLALSGNYGSKFVTVIVTGKDDGTIDFRGYQVSNQGQSLSVDGTIVPTLDAPEYGYTRETTDELYCPDILFREKDEYGNDVTKIGRPLPIEYLLTDMGCNFAVEMDYRVTAQKRGFRYEGEKTTIQDIALYLKHFGKENVHEAIREFSLIISFALNDTLPLKMRLPMLLEAIREGDDGKLFQFLNTSEWLTAAEIFASSTEDSGPGDDLGMDLDDETRLAIERSLRET